MIWILLLMVLNAAYVAALPAATLFYMANVVLHLALGAVVVVWLGRQWRRSPEIRAAGHRGRILGLYLIFGGATTNHRLALWSHIALAVVGLAILVPRSRLPLAALAILAAGAAIRRRPSIASAIRKSCRSP